MVTVECPLCGETVEVPDYDSITRSDALVGHVATYHACRVMPPPPGSGPPLPKFFGLKWPWRE